MMYLVIIICLSETILKPERDKLVCSGRSANNQLALGIDSMGSGFLCFAKPAASWRRYYKYIAYFHIGLVGVR